MKKTNFEKGIFYEQEACKILKSKNLEITATRIKSKIGEIDILAKKEDRFYIVEVKYRKTLENSAYSITEEQFNRSLSVFFEYIQKHNLQVSQYFYLAILFCKDKYQILNVTTLKNQFD